MKKGASQIDYVIAAGMFIIILTLIVQYILNYYYTVSEYSEIMNKNSDAQSLLTISDFEFVPDNWPELIPDSSTILLMHFNNQSGENTTFFKDFSGLGNNGTCSSTSCPSFNLSGKFGNAYTFDGINDYIQTPLKWNSSEYFTIEVWVKTNTLNLLDWQRVIASQRYGGTAINSFDLCQNIDNIWRFIVWNNTGFAWSVNGVTPIQVNQWYHLAAVYYPNNKIQLYVNGVLENETTGINGFGGARDTTIRLGIHDLSYVNRFFNGTIDEVAIYNRPLSAGEILEHYNYGLRLRRIGLSTRAYRFFILVNNTKPYYYNQSLNVSNLTDELVSFNYTLLGFSGIDYKSTTIYDEKNNPVPYQINDTMITFKTNINLNSSKWFTVYFDDDSHFKDKSISISGNNYINETIYPIEKINIIQYKKYVSLIDSNYTAIKNVTATKNNFRIRLYDLNTSSYILTFGDTVPRTGNIIALEKYVLFQNSTGDIKYGKLIVQVW